MGGDPGRFKVCLCYPREMRRPGEEEPAPPSATDAQDAVFGQATKPRRRAGLLAVAAAVFWSFFGVRRRKDHAADIESLTLPQVIIGGIIGAITLIASLIGLVIFVTR